METPQKLYFRTIDDNFCFPLEGHLHDAKIEGLEEIELLEAIPDNDTKEYVWCSFNGEVEDREICKKSECSEYSSKSGRGVCKHRGKLFLHGETVKFKVS